MANTVISYDEIRMDVRDENFTHVYVWITNVSKDGMFGVEGWHHKAFPASMSTFDIMKAWFDGKEDPLLWEFKDPIERHTFTPRVTYVWPWEVENQRLRPGFVPVVLYGPHMSPQKGELGGIFRRFGSDESRVGTWVSNRECLERIILLNDSVGSAKNMEETQ